MFGHHLLHTQLNTLVEVNLCSCTGRRRADLFGAATGEDSFAPMVLALAAIRSGQQIAGSNQVAEPMAPLSQAAHQLLVLVHL